MRQTSRLSVRPARRLVVAFSTAALLAVSFVGAAPATAAERPSHAATVAVAEAGMRQLVDAGSVDSIGVSISTTDALVWAGDAGAIDEQGTPRSTSTMNGIGSVSKMFATTAVMQLVDQGKVGLDQPVVKYLPQFTMRSPQYRQITVRMLLNHTAGLPGTAYRNGFTSQPWKGYADLVLKNLATSTLKTTPGAMAVYCNDCFTLAGEVVAEVSGLSYPAYVKRNILAPLGMTDSMFVTSTLPPEGSAARVFADGKMLPLEVTNVHASGGLMSTATDMAAFGRMLLGKGTLNGTQVLSPQSVAEMGRLQTATTLDPMPDTLTAYGLGWDTVRELNLSSVGVRAWMKGGDTTDFHSGLIVAPEAGLTVFVSGAGQRFSSAIAEALGEEIMLNALAERGDITAVPSRLGTDQPPAAQPTEDDVNAMLGIYLGTPTIGVRFTRGDGDTLIGATLAGGAWVNPVPLTFRADGAWWPQTEQVRSFRSVTGWSRTYLVLSTPDGYGAVMGNLVIGQRVEPSGKTAAAWTKRLGTYVTVSDGFTSTVWTTIGPVGVFSQIPDLPGYIDAGTNAPVDAHAPNAGTMFLQVPGLFGRDMDDVVVLPNGYLRMGSSVIRPLATVPVVAAGRTSVMIGRDGWAEWAKVDAASTVSVQGARAWRLASADLRPLAAGTKTMVDRAVAADTYLIVFGEPGQRVTVTVG